MEVHCGCFIRKCTPVAEGTGSRYNTRDWLVSPKADWEYEPGLTYSKTARTPSCSRKVKGKESGSPISSEQGLNGGGGEWPFLGLMTCLSFLSGKYLQSIWQSYHRHSDGAIIRVASSGLGSTCVIRDSVFWLPLRFCYRSMALGWETISGVIISPCSIL